MSVVQREIMEESAGDTQAHGTYTIYCAEANTYPHLEARSPARARSLRSFCSIHVLDSQALYSPSLTEAGCARSTSS